MASDNASKASTARSDRRDALWTAVALWVMVGSLCVALAHTIAASLL